MHNSRRALVKSILLTVQVMSKASHYTVTEKEGKYVFQLAFQRKILAESNSFESLSAAIKDLGRFIYWAECQNELYKSFFSVRTFEAA